MMNNFKTALVVLAVICGSLRVVAQASNSIHELKKEEVVYMADGIPSKGYIVYDAAIKGKKPAILVVPEWWGCNDYAKRRADMLAELGYVAMAVDMYGQGAVALTPEDAQKMATPFYSDPKLGKARIDAAEKRLKENTEVDPGRIGAIGYCFGGSMVLNDAKMGADFKATVSFHGGLDGVRASKGSVKGKILVCHGGADKFVNPEVKGFRGNMDSAGVRYTFKVYENATHAFTNPDATANGKKFNMPIEYNEKADKESWEDMKQFLQTAFSSK